MNLTEYNLIHGEDRHGRSLKNGKWVPWYGSGDKDTFSIIKNHIDCNGEFLKDDSWEKFLDNLICSSDDAVKKFKVFYGDERFNTWLTARMIQSSCIMIGSENVLRLTRGCDNFEVAIKKVFANIICVLQNLDSYKPNSKFNNGLDIMVGLFTENRRCRFDIIDARKRHRMISRITTYAMDRNDRDILISEVFNAVEGIKVKKALNVLDHTGTY